PPRASPLSPCPPMPWRATSNRQKPRVVSTTLPNRSRMICSPSWNGWRERCRQGQAWRHPPGNPRTTSGGPESLPMESRLNSLLARLLLGSAIPLVLFVGVALIASIVILRLFGTLTLETHTHEVITHALLQQQKWDDLRSAVQVDPMQPRFLLSNKW